MPNQVERLIEQWLQYLKGLQLLIVKNDGSYKYKKTPTVGNFLDFLEIKTNYNSDKINKVIKQVLKKNQTVSNNPVTVQDRTPKADTSSNRSENEPVKQEYTSDDGDVKVADKEKSGPGIKSQSPYKPKFKYRYKENITEEIDRESTLSEDEIKQIFQLLTNPLPNSEKPSQYKSTKKKQEIMNRLRLLVRDSMQPVQRKLLWARIVIDTN